jgi:hypothetical protein
MTPVRTSQKLDDVFKTRWLVHNERYFISQNDISLVFFYLFVVMSLIFNMDKTTTFAYEGNLWIIIKALSFGNEKWSIRLFQPRHLYISYDPKTDDKTNEKDIGELLIHDIPWFHAPQGRKPNDMYFTKKMCSNDLLFLVFSHLDLLDLIRLSLVNQDVYKRKQLYFIREKIPTDSIALKCKYRYRGCQYSLCVSFENYWWYCQHDYMHHFISHPKQVYWPSQTILFTDEMKDN